MVVKVSTGEMVLEALMENPNIKAALVVDDRGYIVDKRGSAACLKDAESDDVTLVSSKKNPQDNLYLVELEQDFLVVIFDDKFAFERLKEGVDAVLDDFDLRPADESDDD